MTALRSATAWLTVTLVSGPSALCGQAEIVTRGNQYYQDGDYLAAIEAYEAVLDAGFESGDLYYNLGNAYFKSGDLGRSILAWERALVRAPGNPDAVANLELAGSLTVDAVEPLPRFWVLSVISWWVGLLSRGVLIPLVAVGWLAVTGGTITRVLARTDFRREAGKGVAVVGAIVVLLFGTNLAVRELGLGQADRAVVLADAVPVRSAPAEDDDLTLFEIHEGTRVRIDQRAGEWAEIVLDDGKVGWVSLEAIGVI
jgi:tetratricopeptide (TPR) repeat protein